MKTPRPVPLVCALMFAASLISSPAVRAAAAPPSPVAALAQAKVEAQAQADVAKATDTGKKVGTAALSIISIFVANNQKGASAAEKGLIVTAGTGLGYVLGGAAGKAIGETIAQRRRQYGREQAFLESEIQTANAALATRGQKIAEAQQAGEQRKAEIARLQSQTMRTHQDISAAKASLAEVDRQIAENNALLEQYQAALAYLEETLKTSTPEKTAAAAERAQWAEKKSALEAKRVALAGQVQTLQGVGTELAKDRTSLAAITT
jgi:chromosome segregation ATPase